MRAATIGKQLSSVRCVPADPGHVTNNAGLNSCDVGYPASPFGATEPSQDIRSRYFDNMGNTFEYTYEVTDDTLTIWGGERGSPAYYQGKFSEDGTNTGAWQPGGGGYDSTMTRVN